MSLELCGLRTAPDGEPKSAHAGADLEQLASAAVPLHV